MHPLKLLCPLLDMVFHVTNNGCASSSLVLHIELTELAGVAVPELLVLLFFDVEEEDEGRLLLLDVAESRFKSREIAAGRAGSASAMSSSSSSSSSSPAATSALLLLLA